MCVSDFGKSRGGHGRHAYPLQLSHLKGRRSSCLQKGIWQCAPIASTSPVDILLNDSSPAAELEVGFEEAILLGSRVDDIGFFAGYAE